MNRIQRKTIALCMSFVLLIFTICQAQAITRVSLPAADTVLALSTEMPAGCHEPMGDQEPLAPDCHEACQNVHQADLAKKLQLPDATTLFAVLELPVMAQTAATQSLAMLPAWLDPGDPHPVIRFQRFLE